MFRQLMAGRDYFSAVYQKVLFEEAEVVGHDALTRVAVTVYCTAPMADVRGWKAVARRFLWRGRKEVGAKPC